MTNALHTPRSLSCSIMLAVGCWWTLHQQLDAAEPPTQDRPNILWITVEDMSPNLGCYSDGYARTPAIDSFASQSIRYTHAFATAPVCSPARSCLITGMYATSLGTQRLRSRFPVPPEFRAFTVWLREAGYYCTNNSKTDYNLRDEPSFVRAAWDASSPQAHWRGRRPGQPFFAVFNLMTTHQSRTSVWSHEEFEKNVGQRLAPEQRHAPEAAPVPPYYPDTPEVRRTIARYYDCITAMDEEVGEILGQLEQDGLADDTIVFFYSDHGMGLPRGKRVLHDTGMHVPLLIRFPAKHNRFTPKDAEGDVSHRLVSFVDFAPTVLSLAGIPIPQHMQGVAFLGPAAGDRRQFVYGARDRVDEVLELSRSVRDARYLYIRNYMPHLSWMQPERYSDNSDMRKELKRLAAEGRLNAAQLTYAAPRKPLEELYDTQSDPHQIQNLAGSPQHSATLEKLRGQLREWMFETRDVGFLAEPLVWQRFGNDSTPFAMARDEKQYPLARLLSAAELVGRPEQLPRQIALLSDPDDGVRYWAALGLKAAGEKAAPARDVLRGALKDPSAVVRVEAAAALVALDGDQRALGALQEDLANSQPEAALHAARALELLGEAARPALSSLLAAMARAKQIEPANEMGMFIRFSLEAALENLQ